MREWTERHIRELIDDEYKKLKKPTVTTGTILIPGIAGVYSFYRTPVGSGDWPLPWVMNNYTIVDSTENVTTLEVKMYGQDSLDHTFYLNGEQVMGYNTCNFFDGEWTGSAPVQFQACAALPIALPDTQSSFNEASVITKNHIKDFYMYQDDKKFGLHRYQAVNPETENSQIMEIQGFENSPEYGATFNFKIPRLITYIYTCEDKEGYESWSNYDFYRYVDNYHTEERIIRFEVYNKIEL